MSRLVTVLSAGILAVGLISATAFVAVPAAAAPTSDADKAAAKDATAKCRAQVKEQAHFEEMSLYARHKLVKKCVKDMLAGH
jgi:stress-induced morphogen